MEVQRDPNRYREVVEKVILYMTLGVDVSRLFSEMVLVRVSAEGLLEPKKKTETRGTTLTYNHVLNNGTLSLCYRRQPHRTWCRRSSSISSSATMPSRILSLRC